VENPLREVIYNGGTIYNSLEFVFKAESNGIYLVNFENANPSNQQTVEYSLTYPAFPAVASSLMTFAGAALFGAGVSIWWIQGRRQH
jgi:hypothetical protein